MTTTSLPLPGTTSTTARPSRSTLIRAALFVLTVLVAAAIAFVIGHETTGSVHVVRTVTPASYTPDLPCRVGFPC